MAFLIPLFGYSNQEKSGWFDAEYLVFFTICHDQWKKTITQMLILKWEMSEQQQLKMRFCQLSDITDILSSLGHQHPWI